jgi:hypothetical protein
VSDKALSSLTRTTTTDTGDLMYVVDEGNARGIHVGSFRTGIGLPATGASTDNAVPRFDGTGGKLQNSGVTISDTGLMTMGDTPSLHPEVFSATTVLRIADNSLGAAGTAVSGSANEFGVSILTDTPVTSSAAGYEKCAAIFIARTADPSVYTPSQILRDTVGLDMRGYISTSNTLGRAWGGYSEARIFTGGNGYLVAHEFFVVNEGTEEASLDTQTGKFGQVIVSNGSVPATAGSYITAAGGGTFRRGWTIDAAALKEATDPAFGIDDGSFVVTRAGNVTLAGGLRVGFTGAPGAADRVEVGDGNFVIDFGGGTSPQISFDSTDLFYYNRSADAYVFRVGGTDKAVISGAAIRPAANDGLALGSAVESWSDLFLAEGGVINWDNGDVTVTQSGNSLTIAGGNLIFPGTTTNDSAAAGIVGEIIESEILAVSAVSLTASTTANVTSISLTAGDWDVWGTVFFDPAGTTSVTAFQGGINTTSATQPTLPGAGATYLHRQAAFVPVGDFGFPVGMRRLSLSATTTVYLVALGVFTVDTLGAYGYIGARRVR